jgi:DUF971 family protein
MTEQPVEITLHQQARKLEIDFTDDSRCRLPYEFLRVHPPSVEMRGHDPVQEVFQCGMQGVNVPSIGPVGSYAIKNI